MNKGGGVQAGAPPPFFFFFFFKEISEVQSLTILFIHVIEIAYMQAISTITLIDIRRADKQSLITGREEAGATYSTTYI